MRRVDERPSEDAFNVGAVSLHARHLLCSLNGVPAGVAEFRNLPRRRRRQLRFSAARGGSSAELHLTVECATNRVIGCVRACFFGLSRCWNTNRLRNHQTASVDERNEKNKRDIGEKNNHTTPVMCPAAENLPRQKSFPSQQTIERSPSAPPSMCALYPQGMPSWCGGLVPVISHVICHYPHLQSIH